VSEEIQRHFEQAAECLEDARVLLDNNRLTAAVTRVYYAMFHAGTGALLARGVRRSSHHALLAAFGQTLVKTGELDQRFYRDLRAAFQRRQQADYEATLEVDRQAAGQLYEQAIDFVDACRRLTL
jgi:uncharacterized protein (UPF0332 family)